MHAAWIGVAALMLGSPARLEAQAQAAGAELTYVIGIGESLQVSVWKNPDLSVTVPVRPDGQVSLPLVGEVEVVGRTPRAVRQTLTELYSEFITSPAVSLVVQQINSREVFILGEIRNPGSYEILRPTRVVQLLAMAGGLTDFAKKDEVILIRESQGGPERFVLSIKEVQSGKRLEENIWLMPGDTVIVP